MYGSRQSGFTLIEVLVALSVFALCAAALYATFSEATNRTFNTQKRLEAGLIAQSLLAKLRATPAPWKPDERGEIDGKWQWRVTSAPYPGLETQRQWRAVEVTIQLTESGVQHSQVDLRSVELVRESP